MAYILITGASGGIGEEFARQFAAQGRDLILVARNQDRLAALAKELSEKHSIRVETLPQDLSKLNSAEQVFHACDKAGWQVDLLINNAGIGMFGPFVSQNPQNLEEMMLLNMVTLTKLTRLFLPAMLAKKSGGVINVASTAAFQPIPTFAVYAATKAYVLSLSEALHEEVGAKGVTVMALCPGPTETEFFSRAEKASGIKGGINIGLQKADEVVRLAISRFKRGERLALPGLLNKMAAFSTRLAPRSLVAKVAERMVKTGAGI